MVLPNQVELLKHFSSFLFEAGLSSVSIKNYLSDVRHFLSFSQSLPGVSMEQIFSKITEFLPPYLEAQQSTYTPKSTTNRRLASIRRFATFLSVKYDISDFFTQQNISNKSNQILSWPHINGSREPTQTRSAPIPTPDEDNNHLHVSSKTMSSDKILEQFKTSLEKEKKTHSTIKNYLSDLNHFFLWTANQTPFTTQNLLNILSESQLQAYITYLKLSHTSTSVLSRRQSSIKKLARFCLSEGYIPKNPFEIKQAPQKIAPLAWIERLSHKAKKPSKGPKNIFVLWYDRYNALSWTPYLNVAHLVLATTAMAIFAYNQIIGQTRPSAAATALTPPRRQLSFQGRLTDSSGTPITTSVNVVFKLFNQLAPPGTQLYTSGTCSITPDQSGIFNSLIGDGVCGSEIGSSVFTDNRDVFLEITIGAETLTPRQQIATVGYALNSETLQGYPASASATINTVPVVDNSGNITIAASSPSIVSTSGTFTVKGQSLALTTAANSGGDIVLQPDSIGSGQILAIGGTTTEDSLRVTNANLTGGTLISGYVGNNTATGRILSLTSGSTETDRFWVATDGRTGIFASDADTALIVNQTSTGNLISASVSGSPVFTVTNGGNVDITGQYLINGTPIGSGSNWQLTSGSLTPLQITNSINIGAIATASALVHLAGTSGENSWINTGNFGIGTTNPSEKLNVSGNVKLTGNLLATTDNTQDLGDSTNSWSRLYLYTGINDKDGTEVISTLNKRLTGGSAWNIVEGARLGDINAITAGYKLDVVGNATASGNISLGGQLQVGRFAVAPTSLGSGSMYFNTTTTTGNSNPNTETPGTTGSLFVYGVDNAYHRLAMDMTQYSSNSANIANQSYIEVAHNQNTNDISLTAWVYNSATTLWQKINDYLAKSVTHDLDNEFNPPFTQKMKTSTVAIDYNENDLGNGADGAASISTDRNLNTTNINNNCTTDGGDAVNYSVTALTSTTATLESTPGAGCLEAGDEILLINLQGGTAAYSNVGNYETLRVSSVSTNVVTFTAAKTKFYGAGASDDTSIGLSAGNQIVMLQRVPNYTDVTISTAGTDLIVDDWVVPGGVANNGAGEGGVMFFRASGTVTVNSGTTINTNGKGYILGTAQTSSTVAADGGEAFCNTDGGGDAGIDNGAGSTGNCGGGGGGGAASGGAGSGSASLGGGGGAGGESTGTTANAGGGGGGGYGSAGNGGSSTSAAGSNGGTNSSGNGGAAGANHGGGGGGGGTYGDTTLADLYFGSSGGGGGMNETDGDAGGNGGDGGGIVYIAANTITVSSTGVIQANGTAGSAGTGDGGGGGGGAGGSVKLVGNTLTLGTSLVTASGGAAGGSGSGVGGGAGGDGRIASYYATSITGTTSPTKNDYTLSYNTYAVYVSEEINTPSATSFGNLSWTETLPASTNIQFQTRSGNTPDSTDGTWETWKPSTVTTNYVDLQTMNTHTDWTGTNATVADGDITRNVDYYEDEDEFTADNLTKITSTAAGGYAEDTISSTDISTHEYISAWVYSVGGGNVLTLGFGEAAATEQTETVTVDAGSTWQKVYWDISDVTGTARNAVTKLRITLTTNSNTVYVDNIKAEKTLLTTPAGSAITSTANNYIQYRAILTTTNTANQPYFSGVQLAYTNPVSTYTIDANRIRQLNNVDYYTSGRLQVTESELDNYKSIHTETALTSITQNAALDPGTGADGAITVTTDTSINTTSLISGRSCADGGDAVNYNVTSLTSTTAVLESTPSTGCLAVGDEVLLINLQGGSSATSNVGNYETLRVSSVVGATVTFTTAKTKFYGANEGDDTSIGISAGSQIVMLQRVPNYTNVTISGSGIDFYPDDWATPDGGVTSGPGEGGVMFFRASGTVTVGSNATIHANGKGYILGSGQTSSTATSDGGEAFCNADGGGDGGIDDAAGSTGNCGGGGGGGAASGGAGSGSASLGGGGGGGGEATVTTANGGGGGGGGYGTAGNGGNSSTAGGDGSNGGTNSSGNGGAAGTQHGGGGGGGGTYGETALDDLYFGSSGGGGGMNEIDLEAGDGGGDGAGIVFIAANTISVSGNIQSNGSAGTETGGANGGGGGGGAGGSIKLIGNALSLGSSLVTATGGSGSTNSGGVAGGNGGTGRIATYYVSSTAGTTDPGANLASVSANNYAIFISDEIPTPNATNLDKLSFSFDQNLYGQVQFQTRSGKSNNATDGSWEIWKPVVVNTNIKTLNAMDATGDWSVTSLSAAADGVLARNVDEFEDEDITNAANKSVKFGSVGSANGYAEDTISSTDLSNYDLISAWIYATSSGNIVKLGFGESAGNEQEETFTVDTANTWQKVYWDITDIDESLRNAVTKLRVSILSTNTTVYVDSLQAERLMNTASGYVITSTPNEYLQYRAILTTTNSAFRPKLYNIKIDWSNGYKIEQTTANSVRLYNFSGQTQQIRLDAIVFGADLAEWYSVNDSSIEAGELVAITGALDDFGVPYLRKTNQKNDRNILGVISTKAGQTLGVEGENRRLLALAGRVPVKIDLSSPSIKAGDYLTASDKPGLAKKARPGEMTIGRAFESWNREAPTSTVLTIVQQPSETPEVDLSQSVISIAKDTWEVWNQTANIAITRLASFSEVVTGRLTAGLTTTNQLQVETITSLASGSAITINSPVIIRSGILATTLSAQTINSDTLNVKNITTDSITANTIIGLDAKVASLSAGWSTKLSESEIETLTGQIVLQLANSSQQFSEFTQATVANFQAGVSVIGELVTENLTVRTRLITPIADIDQLKVIDATISGTLYADNIKGKTVDTLNLQLDLLNEKYSTASAILADLQSRYSSYDSLLGNLQTATDSADPLALSPLATVSASFPSDMALESLTSRLIFTNDVLASGSVLAQSFSSIDSDLYIQPTGDKPIHLLANLMTLYPDGKVAINGDLLISGTIFANSLDTRTATVSGSLAVGQGNFGQLTTGGLIIASDNPDQSSSISAQVSSNTTIGTATIATGSSEIVIANNKVTDDTLIYITPVSDTSNQVLFVKSKQSGVGFTVAVPGNSDQIKQEISFNYWLVKTK
ncbi:hypothetical protein A3K36_05640 [Candidatus Collierbacteria bacterium RIFOXYD2_FULL_45_13]|nr:MAG: hypothetical protein A3K36_05640 [Candidatus Collierbacteria bacterium RIFOXYD2_FULL_45_13]